MGDEVAEIEHERGEREERKVERAFFFFSACAFSLLTSATARTPARLREEVARRERDGLGMVARRERQHASPALLRRETRQRVAGAAELEGAQQSEGP